MGFAGTIRPGTDDGRASFQGRPAAKLFGAYFPGASTLKRSEASRGLRTLCVALLGSLLLAVGCRCWAQAAAAGGGGSLVDLINSGQYAFNELERLSAIANQASYDELTSNPAGATYCNPALTKASATCPEAVFLVFSNLRSLVQTANALLGNGGPTRYSLNLTDQALGFALRWTAAEELSAPGTVSSQFSKAQMANLASRISALRAGATGFTVFGVPFQSSGNQLAASNGPGLRGGGASADSADIGIASRWGGFVNGSFGWGDRAPSVLEDAFAFDSKDATIGVDYRFTRRFVLGAMAGYTEQQVDFNSALSVVDGSISSHGVSLKIYGLYEWDGPYVSLSVGDERVNYSSTRVITYPSFNILVPSVYATATGSTIGNTLSSTLTLGWPLPYKAFSFEPYLNGDYRRLHLDSFRETSVNNAGPAAGQPAGFDFDYATQRIASLDAAFGTRLQYVFRPSFGVDVWYVKAEYHHLFDNTPGTVVASYNPIATLGASFNIPSDKPTSNFFEFAVGTSLVFKHGIQAYLQYETSADITYVTTHLISGGIRGEF